MSSFPQSLTGRTYVSLTGGVPNEGGCHRRETRRVEGTFKGGEEMTMHHARCVYLEYKGNHVLEGVDLAARR